MIYYTRAKREDERGIERHSKRETGGIIVWEVERK